MLLLFRGIEKVILGICITCKFQNYLHCLTEFSEVMYYLRRDVLPHIFYKYNSNLSVAHAAPRVNSLVGQQLNCWKTSHLLATCAQSQPNTLAKASVRYQSLLSVQNIFNLCLVTSNFTCFWAITVYKCQVMPPQCFGPDFVMILTNQYCADYS